MTKRERKYHKRNYAKRWHIKERIRLWGNLFKEVQNQINDK